MMPQPTHSQQKYLFLLGISALYIALGAWLDFLKGPYWWDEESFWQTSLTFSDHLFPSLSDIREYQELNTPLAFIVFHALEHLFGKGIVAGRLLNLLLSLSMAFIIGWPTKEKGGRAILCLIGLFLCPYYLWLSGRLYTEMIACFWVLMGVLGYIRNRHLWSCIAFVLAIATRQYMVVFPAAIATYEFIVAAFEVRQGARIDWKAQWRWIFPFIAAGSIFLWFYLFQGLVPAGAYQAKPAPDIQKTAWGMDLGGAIHYLSFIAIYIVIPEFLLFSPVVKLRYLKQQWNQERCKIIIIALALLLFALIFPPQEFASGNVKKLANLLPYSSLRWSFYYILALVACLRFAKPNLMGLFIFFNAAIMVKAHPWDRYVLPMVVVFLYLKSLDLVDQYPLPGIPGPRRSSIEPPVPS